MCLGKGRKEGTSGKKEKVREEGGEQVCGDLEVRLFPAEQELAF